MNAAKVSGVIYSSTAIPLSGVEVWCYQLPSTKSAAIQSDEFDPTEATSDAEGKYDILIPSDWGEAVVSVRNYTNYDEIKISPIANASLTHNYKVSPIVIGYGSGSGPGSGNCLDINHQLPSNPEKIIGGIRDFDYLGINNQPETSFVKPNESMRFSVFPKPINSSYSSRVYCSGSFHDLVLYKSIINACIPDYDYKWGGGNHYSYTFQYFISICQVDGLNNPLENERKFEIYEEKFNNHPGYLLVGEINVDSILNEKGVHLEAGNKYKLKLGYWPFFSYERYQEKEVILFVYSTDMILRDPIITGKSYSATNITLTNANVQSDLELQASNSITILPETNITDNFHAFINPGLKGSSTLSYKQKGSILDSKEQKNVQYPGSEINNRYVSKLSDVCLCENKKIETLNKCENSIIVYPNPATNEITIQFDSDYPGEIVLYDMQGKKIKQMDISGLINNMNVNNLSTGEYMIKVNSVLGYQSFKFAKK